jgi:hypothetical protein
LLGRVKIKQVKSPLFHDGWMGQEVFALLELRDDVRRISVNLWLPDSFAEEIPITASFGGTSATLRASGGMNSLTFNVQGRNSEEVPFALRAGRTRVAGTDDSRQVSVIVDSVIFEN